MDVAAQISAFAHEPEISFPQADSFQRVINICELLESQELSRDDVTEEYDFDIRQTNYSYDDTSAADTWYSVKDVIGVTA